ncbi:MAG TPA: ribonuclease R [Clostridiaceae bacterium]|jgi:ribonuclease R|nr:ribonuclease R [Clostridiaceae bacterium]
MSRKRKENLENCIKGVFRGNEKGFGFVKIDGQDEEIYISRGNTKDAVNGDEVLIKIINDTVEGNRKEGKIVKTINHKRNEIVGTFTKRKNFGFVVPDDREFNTDIFISKKSFNKAKNNQKVVVKITKFPQGNKSAEGEITEIIGGINEAGVDMLSLIKEYNLPYEFPDEVILEAKKVENKITKKELQNRLDLRSKNIFTIDGEDAKDLDDAIYVTKLENGNYELGVSIADVSHYVAENSKLDQEAIIRGTSIYMLDRVIPMLPKELSNGICSLNANEDRLCLSVISEITPDGEIVSSDIRKAVINVKERMSYADVQKILDGKNKKVLKRYEKYIEDFKLMEELAKILKQKREGAGSLDLDIPESKVILDKNGFAIDIEKYKIYFANEIIEQFMLTANEIVAEKFYWLEAPFIYRVHEEPDTEKVNALNKFLFNFGYKIKSNKEKVYPKAFAEVLEKVKGREEEMVVSNLILRTLKVARYESENKGHFGIASKYYCHFTSPIRRYPDLFIHRIISKYIDNSYILNEKNLEKYKEQATKYSQTSSEREKIAQKVEREAIAIKKAEYMQNKIGKEYEGIVSGITAFGMFVELENTVEGLIKFEDLGNEYFIYNDENKTLIGENSKKVYKIGDKIKIKVIYANKQLRRINFKAI